MVRSLGTALAAVALVVLTGCGDGADDVTATSSDGPVPTASDTPTDTVDPAPAALPRCDRTWVVGTALPDGYVGCRADGRRSAESVRCETGQMLHTYGGRFFGVPGGPVFEAAGALADDAQFQKMERVCRA